MITKRRRLLSLEPARKLTVALWFAACFSGQQCANAQALSMPAWLAAFPGAAAQTRNSPGLVESTYEAAAKPDEVVAHYRKLFETAGLTFQAGFDGMGTVIRGAAPECDLLIAIRQQGAVTSVRVDCSARSAAYTTTAVSEPPARMTVRPSYEESVAKMHENTRKLLEKRDEEDRKRLLEMEKFDHPVRPKRRPPAPTPVWPAWLVNIDGARLQIEKGVDFVGMKFLKCSFVTSAERNVVESFYRDLLNANGYPVSGHSMESWPQNRKSWVDAAYYPYGEDGPRLAVHLDLLRVGDVTQVEIRMTSYT